MLRSERTGHTTQPEQRRDPAQRAVSVYWWRRGHPETEENYVRVLFTILGGVAISMCLAAQPAGAAPATDFEKFLKQVQKFAKRDQGKVLDPKVKGMCVCQDEGPLRTRAGVLIHSGVLGDPDITVRCFVRRFNPNGENAEATPCDLFEVLTK